ncbi:MAG: hypothetical protein JRE23_16925 [Deltaproteobacteria bacterium]|nr:hypothetical protein [Deltaproteobacteria bacterium]
MNTFSSWNDYWNFDRLVRRETRYIYDESVEEFLSAVVATSKSREMGIRKGSILWRAQLGCNRRVEYHPEVDEEIEEDGPQPSTGGVKTRTSICSL